MLLDNHAASRPLSCTLAFPIITPPCLRIAPSQSDSTVRGLSALWLISASVIALTLGQSLWSAWVVFPVYLLFMFLGLSYRNNVVIFTPWRMHHKDNHAMPDSQRLQAQLPVSITGIFTRYCEAIKNSFTTHKIQMVRFYIRFAFGFVIGNHSLKHQPDMDCSVLGFFVVGRLAKCSRTRLSTTKVNANSRSSESCFNSVHVLARILIVLCSIMLLWPHNVCTVHNTILHFVKIKKASL
jgi:hypothetical protein